MELTLKEVRVLLRICQRTLLECADRTRIDGPPLSLAGGDEGIKINAQLKQNHSVKVEALYASAEKAELAHNALNNYVNEKDGE